MSGRQARVSDAGCGIFLTERELRELGIDPDAVDTVNYTVADSEVVLSEAGGGD